MTTHTRASLPAAGCGPLFRAFLILVSIASVSTALATTAAASPASATTTSANIASTRTTPARTTPATAASPSVAGRQPDDLWSTYPGEPRAGRVEPLAPVEAEELSRSGFDVTFRGDTYAEMLLREGEWDRLTERGYSVTALTRDLFAGARTRSREGNLDPQYSTYAEMLAVLEELAFNYPSICRIYDIGDAESKEYTWSNYNQQYDLWAVRISDNPDFEEPEPTIVYDGRHHAREPVATEMVLAVARHFCENYGTDPAITELVNTTEIWCVPMVNPDGHQWVEDIDPWWRKTLYDHDQDHHVDDYEGIDPNRNYDWHWDPGYWSDQTYGGPYPFRAPEVAAMRDLHNAHRPAINPSYHSYGEVVLYPFGYGVLGEPAVIEVASEYASLIGYDPEQSTTAHGSSKDWLYGTVGTVSFTVETATTFIPSGPTMEAIVQQLLPGSLWLTERLWGPSIHGTVTDSITGMPLEATIHIPEIMDIYGGGELWDMVTEAATGYFCRMCTDTPQDLTLEVSAEGYFSKSIPVTTSGEEATVLAIELVPESFDRGFVQGTVTNETAGGTPVPGATVEVIGAGAFLETRPDGTYSGYVQPGTFQLTVVHESFAPDTSGFVLIEVGEITTVDFSLTDIAGPEITNTTELQGTDDEVGPYLVESTITDMSGLAGQNLYYRTLGQSWQSVPMSPVGPDRFEAGIDGQPHGTMVYYYVEAADQGGNVSTDPAGAPGVVYSFYVAPFVEDFADDMEGTLEDWSHYVVTSGFNDQWHASTARNHSLPGTTSWKCGSTAAGDYAGLLDAALETPPVALGEYGRMSFWYWIDAEESGAYPGQAYDGGLIELSAGGGAWTQVMPEEGYTHVIRAGAGGPFAPGTPVFSGSSGTWQQVQVDLSAYAGEEVRVRFRFGSDSNTGGEGWYLDDLVIESMDVPSAAPEEAGDRVDANAPLHALTMRISPNPARPSLTTTVDYALSMPAEVQLRILDLSGRVVQSIEAGGSQASGRLSWSGADRLGRPVPAGVYFLRLQSGESILAQRRAIRLR